MTKKREMFLIPQKAVTRIVCRYGYEKLGELAFLLSQYCLWWDEHGDGESFDFSPYDEVVLVYFDMIRPEVDEKHRQFFETSARMAEVADERWMKESRRANQREKKRQWYVDNSEKVNRKKREKRLAMASAVQNEASSHASSHAPQRQADKGLAESDAYAYRNYEFMNNRNHKKNYDMGGAEFVDKSAVSVKHDPSGSLTGHKPPAEACGRKPERCPVLKEDGIGKGKRGKSETGTMSGEQGLGKEVVSPLAPRRTVWGSDWVKIGDDFTVDLFDPMFEDFARARKFLINGFENWCRKKLVGEKHDKWWLRDQLGRNFANRQGSIGYMFGRKECGR